jgi:acyl-CoA dehydrogenase
VLISGESPFCETFFDDVKVPCHQLVGEPNRGWEIAKYLLTHEREMISAIGSRGFREPMGRHAAKVIGVDAQRRLDDPMLRAQIAQFEIDEAAFAAAGERARDLAKQGEGMAAFSSVLKYYGAELNKRRYELLMSVGGTDALGGKANAARTAPWRGLAAHKANSIEGGTSEVQLNIVAKRLLGLPGA